MRWYPLSPADARLLGAPDEVDELGSLSLSLDCEWRKDRLFMIVTTFVDETGTDGPRIMLAGFAARLPDWHGFANQWDKLLKKAEIPYSHVLEMKRGDAPFEGWNSAKLLAFEREAAKIINRYCSFGLTVGVDVDTHKNAYAAKMPPKTSPDSAYGMCARQFFEKVPEYVERIMGLRHARINFVFERHDHRFGDAERIFNELKKVDEHFRERLGTITPADKTDFAGLQAADMFAYNARRREPIARFGEVPPLGQPFFAGRKPVECPLLRVNISEDGVGRYHEVHAEIGRRSRLARQKAKKDRRGDAATG